MRRCGYCDFNTYTSTDLGGGGSQQAYASYVSKEIELAAALSGSDKGLSDPATTRGANAPHSAQDDEFFSARPDNPLPSSCGTVAQTPSSCGPVAQTTSSCGPRRGIAGSLKRSDSALPVVSRRRVAAPQPTEDGLSTVYFGGGTPTVLPVGDLVQVLNKLRDTFGLAPGAEVSIEANPDTVSAESIGELAAGGFTRISFGMQSAVPSVLKTLDRTHNPEMINQVVKWARDAGLQVSLDLIYGTPGESLADWRRSVEAAIAANPDHISAYALTIAPNTKLGRLVRHKQLPAPDDDDMADKYLLADELLRAAGYDWYEVSNWAKGGITGPFACRHNMAYWNSDNWWGFGPGAHSHLAGERFWNVNHPRKWAEFLANGELPIADSERLTEPQRALETVFLRLRLASGMTVTEVEAARAALGYAESDELRNLVYDLVRDELIKREVFSAEQRLVLTPKGRLLADQVVRTLT